MIFSCMPYLNEGQLDVFKLKVNLNNGRLHIGIVIFYTVKKFSPEVKWYRFSTLMLFGLNQYPDQHKSRIEFLRRQYDDELAVITEEFDTERAIMLDQHSRETNEISDILFAMDQNFQEREREAKSDFQSLVDEIRNKVIISSSFKDIQFESFNGIKIGFY